jgi:hypothetical protein
MEVGKAMQVLDSAAKMPNPGPPPVFSESHILLALLMIGDSSPLGRIELSRRLALGEGAARTIVKRLSLGGLIAVGKSGCVLTNRGQQVYKVLRLKITNVKSVKARQLALDKISVAVVVRGAASRVRKGLEQRDAAIRAGATGACTLVISKGRYFMPTADRNKEIRTNDELRDELEDSFHPTDGDAVIIVSAPNRELAEQAAVSSAVELMR